MDSLLDKDVISIVFQESYPIVIAAIILGQFWSHKRIMFHCNHKAAVYVLDKGNSHCPNIMKLMRGSVLLAGQHSFNYRAVHIPGEENCLAGSLSQLQIERFHRLAPPCTSRQSMHIYLRSNLQLTTAVEFFIFKALANSTRNSYAPGVNTFVNFILMSSADYFNHTGLLDSPSEELFMYFVSHCATVLNLSVKTIKLCLSGIRNAYIEGGFGDPFKFHNVPMLQLQVLCGIRNCEPQTGCQSPSRYCLLL